MRPEDTTDVVISWVLGPLAGDDFGDMPRELRRRCVETVGTWSRWDLSGDDDEDWDDRGDWHVSGNPLQVALRLDGDAVTIGSAELAWRGHDGRVLRPRDLVTIQWCELEQLLPQLQQTLAAATTDPRRLMRWCPICRQLRSPWDMWSLEGCYGCAGNHLGVVF